MNLLNWNCREFRNSRKVCELHLLVKKKFPKVVFLLETKCRRNKVEFIHNKLNFEHSFVVDCIGRGGGIAMMWKKELHADLQSHSKAKWMLTRFYGSPIVAKQVETLDDFSLSDLGYKKSRFTWCNNREGMEFTKERLDRAIGNKEWNMFFSTFEVHVLPVLNSDHCPLFISCYNVNKTSNREKRNLRYKANWSRQEDYSEIVKLA
ncbi:hypothetical protein I3842_03G109300 [Carya illinoinensis]|uniref:Endonuclease/exonuclease/phosphatase domain-containing protein n=1 Tax=Carya illinoinensis TaxID=32201 RepID=A0A922FF33_CARIL|nr:hypothetical protein I3842_03G109300 [Carya illinoinensis]